MLPFSADTRMANLARMAEERFDVLVIEGGITGVGIALDAAARGFSVALIEKQGFAAGTSGRSSPRVRRSSASDQESTACSRRIAGPVLTAA